MGSTRDQLLRFLSENTSEKIFPKTIDEEIYEGLWKVRDAKGKTEVIQHLNIEFGKAKTEVRLVLRNESTRPVLLKAISTSTGFRLSPIMTSKYWQPTRTSTEVPKLNGRPPALDVSISG
jgi:regulatory protein YycH of two-component signal transduction system YycFG